MWITELTIDLQLKIKEVCIGIFWVIYLCYLFWKLKTTSLCFHHASLPPKFAYYLHVTIHDVKTWWPQSTIHVKSRFTRIPFTTPLHVHWFKVQWFNWPKTVAKGYWNSQTNLQGTKSSLWPATWMVIPMHDNHNWMTFPILPAHTLWHC